MANEDSVLREVDQELAEERQWALFRKYGPAVIGAATMVVVGVGGWQVYSGRKADAIETRALEYRDAVALLSEDRTAGRAALGALSSETSEGYGVLARFQRAASLEADGDRRAAIEAYREIYLNSGAPDQLKDFARLRSAYASLVDGRDAALGELGGLENGDSVFASYASEIAGIAALDAGDFETALSIFRRLTVDVTLSDVIRFRAEEYAALAEVGKTGVDVSLAPPPDVVNVDQLTEIFAPPAASGDPVSDGASDVVNPPIDGPADAVDVVGEASQAITPDTEEPIDAPRIDDGPADGDASDVESE
ncbi:MAG: tetratricopeptide repeat protein [Pseudomonadota bacterium]